MRYTIYLSRFFTGALLLFAGLFVIFGCLYFYNVYTKGGSFASLPHLAVLFFFFILPSLIIWKETTYIINPPVMLEVTENEISFGTGLGYNMHSVPASELVAIRSFGRLQSVSSLQWSLGVQLEFNKQSESPGYLATSAGIMYANHVLRLRGLYMSKSTKQTISEIQKILPHVEVKGFGVSAGLPGG